MLPSVVPLLNLVTLTPKLKPVSCDPLPKKNVPAILAADVILPVALNQTAVRNCQPCTLAVALIDAPCTKAAVLILPPVILPIAETCPASVQIAA
jgi:hypothetical protein